MTKNDVYAQKNGGSKTKTGAKNPVKSRARTFSRFFY